MQIALWVIWVLIGVLAVATEILWTRRAAKKLGVSPAARPARFAAFSLTPSVLVAVVLTARLMTDHDLRYLAGVWMMCYGTGLYAAGLFSLRLPRLLGLAFILLGAAALFLLSGYGILWVAASFGLLHILFGVAVQRRAQGAEA